MLELNKIHCGNFAEIAQSIDDESIDLVVTSPPYDNLRVYEGYVFEFKTIAQELTRVLKPGGVIVWVVADATLKGTETGTSFTQALYFKELGLNLHDTMIWVKTGQGAVGSRYGYWQNFEYMFVLSKGRPKSFNPIEDRPNKVKGVLRNTTGGRNKKGEITSRRTTMRKEFGRRFNNWTINQDTKTKHPAPFPEQLAHDHIISWSNEGDLVLDPMCGSGTTCKAAKETNRNFIGVDISEKYCELAINRID